MKKITQLLVAVLVLVGFTATAQKTLGAGTTGTLNGPIVVPSIAEQIANGTMVYADNIPRLGHAKGRGMNTVVPGKGSTGNDPLVDQQRSSFTTQSRAPLLSFIADVSAATPSDPTGAAGPNHYVAAWNIAYRVFNKDGDPLTAELSLASLFPGNAIGDPIVFFDANVDNGPGEPRGRFVVTQFDSNPNGFNVAVCQGPDPVNDGWHVYDMNFGTGAFPDYTKFSVWGDSYIVTANIGAANRVFAVERNEMINGDPAQFVGFPLPGIVTNGFYSPQGFHTTADETVPPGTPAPIVYLQDDAWNGASDDQLNIWEARIDWANPANHSITLAQEIETADFVSVFDGGSFSNIGQGGGVDVDVLQATMMNQVQYRRFGTHNSVVMNFVVDVLDPGEKAGIRWYELRQTGDNEDWTIFQEGTFVAPGKRSAYSGSMVMNEVGDIAMTYTSSSDEDRISINYTGRFAGDPLNIMTVQEQRLATSTAANPSNRLADYTQTTIDPVDGSYWNISEYFEPTRRDIVTNFVLDPAQPNDLSVFGVLTPLGENVYTDDEDVTFILRNFGSNDIVNPTVQYVVNGGAPVVETFSLTLAAAESIELTFTQGADLSEENTTYNIAITALLDGDSNNDNDTLECVAINTVGQSCQPATTGGCLVDGIKMFVLEDITADNGGDGCNTEPAGGPQGYADRRNLATDLARAAGENEYIMQIQQNWPGSVGVSAVSAWIDFNDDGIFEPSEQLITQEFFTVFLQLDDFNLVIPTDATIGSHVLRVRSVDTSGTGDVNNPCGNVQFGETQDYTVNIVQTLSVNDVAFQDASFNISSSDNNNFDINVTTSFDGRGAISVYNLLGQQLVFNNLEKQGNSFNYSLNMSYAASGVYLVKFLDIDGDSSLVKKIIVR